LLLPARWRFANTLPRIAVTKYLHVVGIGIQNTLVYRVNYLARVLFGFVPLLATIYLWRAVYASKEGDMVGAYSLAAMTSYYVLVTIVDALTAVSEDDWQIAADIKDGNISQFLLKPIDYLGYRLSLFFSGRLIYTGVALIPVTIFVWCLREYFVVPTDALTLAAFAMSIVLASLLTFLISYSMALLAFWVTEVSTFIFIEYAFEYIASGHLFPLDILPPALKAVLEMTPFPYMLYFPVGVYLGRVEGAELWRGLLIQAAWVLLFYLVARWVWSRGVRRYSAVGG
jgi:ABC-2 type transport system permease protein